MIQLTPARPEFAPLSIVRALTKHWVMLLAIWLLLAAIPIVVVMKWPATYRAEALVLVDSQKIPEKYVSSSVASDLQDRLATIGQQILSTDQLKKLIDDFDLYRDEKKNHVEEEIIEHMRKDIGEIKVEKGWSRDHLGAFRIAYEGPVPTTVADVANRLANLFIIEDMKARENQAQGTSDFLKNRLNDAKKKLNDLEARVSTYKVQHNGELPQQEASLNASLQRLQLQLQGTDEAVNRAQQTKVILENALGMAESAQSTLARAISEANAPEPSEAGRPAVGAEIPQSLSGSAKVQQDLDAMRVRYGDEHPDVRRLRDELARVKVSEAKGGSAVTPVPVSAPTSAPTVRSARRSIVPELSRQLAQEREKASNVSVQLKNVNRELETRANERKRVLDAIDAFQKRLEHLPIREQEMERLTRDYQNSKEEYKSLLEKMTQAEMATEMERRQKAERFTLLDRARIPERPISPNRPLLITAGVLFSLVLGMAFVIGGELKRNCLLGEWELPKDVVTIGRVPVIDFIGYGPPARRRWRTALVSSAVISLLVVAAVGLYYVLNGR